MLCSPCDLGLELLQEQGLVGGCHARKALQTAGGMVVDAGGQALHSMTHSSCLHMCDKRWAVRTAAQCRLGHN